MMIKLFASYWLMIYQLLIVNTYNCRLRKMYQICIPTFWSNNFLNFNAELYSEKIERTVMFCILLWIAMSDYFKSHHFHLSWIKLLVMCNHHESYRDVGWTFSETTEKGWAFQYKKKKEKKIYTVYSIFTVNYCMIFLTTTIFVVWQGALSCGKRPLPLGKYRFHEWQNPRFPSKDDAQSITLPPLPFSHSASWCHPLQAPTWCKSRRDHHQSGPPSSLLRGPLPMVTWPLQTLSGWTGVSTLTQPDLQFYRHATQFGPRQSRSAPYACPFFFCFQVNNFEDKLFTCCLIYPAHFQVSLYRGNRH